MERLLKIAELRDLEKQVMDGEISYSRMVEIINEKHFKELVDLRYRLRKDRKFTEAEISSLQSKIHKITGNGEVMALFNQLLGIAAG